MKIAQGYIYSFSQRKKFAAFVWAPLSLPTNSSTHCVSAMNIMDENVTFRIILLLWHRRAIELCKRISPQRSMFYYLWTATTLLKRIKIDLHTLSLYSNCYERKNQNHVARTIFAQQILWEYGSESTYTHNSWDNHLMTIVKKIRLLNSGWRRSSLSASKRNSKLSEVSKRIKSLRDWLQRRRRRGTNKILMSVLTLHHGHDFTL